jgi:hypothetical protein
MCLCASVRDPGHLRSRITEPHAERRDGAGGVVQRPNKKRTRSKINVSKPSEDLLRKLRGLKAKAEDPGVTEAESLAYATKVAELLASTVWRRLNSLSKNRVA